MTSSPSCSPPPTHTNEPLRHLADNGIAIALDDFGTGYSSLQHLRHLPIAEIKIDRSFVAGIAHNHDDYAIVRSTIDLAHALHIRTVAEGVENLTTWQRLKTTGCDLAQGWHTAPALPADQILAWPASSQTQPQPS